MKKTYKFADVTIEIESLYETIHNMCSNYVSSSKPQLIIKTDINDIIFEREKSQSEDLKEGHEVRQFSNEYLETLAVYRKIADKMMDFDTLLFHGSVIAVDGEGYLFTAKSGTGKSTHTKLWREYFGNRAVMVNDDKPLIHITKDGAVVYGTPWDGKHHLSSNMCVPLKAVCILSRDTENHIEIINGKKEYSLLLQQTYRTAKPAKMIKTLELLDRLIENVHIYSLGCNMESDAPIVAYKGMQ